MIDINKDIKKDIFDDYEYNKDLKIKFLEDCCELTNKNIKPDFFKCNYCGIEKEFNTDNFISDKHRVFSLTTICKSCKYDKAVNYTKNPENKENIRISIKHRRARYYLKPENKIVRAIRGSIKRILKYKDDRYENKDLGYSKYYLMNHLEKLFDENMNWDNYGTWHIDHIIPISKFDKSTPMNIINHLNNLQPLNGIENIRKNNRILLIPEISIGEYKLFLNENKKYELF